MALFQRSLGSNASADPTSFHPLFRFLDDFDHYNQNSSTNKGPRRSHNLRTFSPKFDVKETPDSYELHGELPGIEQKDVDIEFTDGQTLVIHGHTERSYTKGTPPIGMPIEGKKSDAITEQGESGHQPIVEDEDEAKKHENGEMSRNTSVATQSKKETQHQPQDIFWVSERSIGEFSRSFNFPSNIDTDAVSASMKNGILSIVVPKVKKVGGRKIQITSWALNWLVNLKRAQKFCSKDVTKSLTHLRIMEMWG